MLRHQLTGRVKGRILSVNNSRHCLVRLPACPILAADPHSFPSPSIITATRMTAREVNRSRRFPCSFIDPPSKRRLSVTVFPFHGTKVGLEALIRRRDD